MMKILQHSIVVSFFMISAWASATIAPGDPGWPKSYPEWWYNADDPANGVIDATVPVLNQDNAAVLNQGQLLNMASQAIDELNVQLAPIGGAGFDIDAFRDSSESPDYYAPANLGQLKNVSSKFFDRFTEIGFEPGDPGWPTSLVLNESGSDNSPLYPWLNDITAENTESAVIGQAKHLFSWNIREHVLNDSDFDGLPDSREIQYGYDPAKSGRVGFLGEYYWNYHNPGLPIESGIFAKIQVDSNTNLAWGSGGPHGVDVHDFALRWTGIVIPDLTQAYTFSAGVEGCNCKSCQFMRPF